MTTRRAVLRGAVLGGLVAPAVGCGLLDPPIAAGSPPAGSIPLRVVWRDLHTDVGLPVALLDDAARADWVRAVSPLAWSQTVPREGMVAFGFGAKGYMMIAAPGLDGALEAVMGVPGAVGVGGLPRRAEDIARAREVIDLSVPPAGITGLLRFVREEITRDPAGAPMLVPDGPYFGRSLFDARRRFNAGFTCNSWTVEALRAAGLPMPGTGIVWPGELMRHVRRLAAAQASA